MENIVYTVTERYYGNETTEVFTDKYEWKKKIREVSVVWDSRGMSVRLAIYDASESEEDDTGVIREKRYGTQGRHDYFVTLTEIPDDWILLDEEIFEPVVIYFDEETQKYKVNEDPADEEYDTMEQAEDDWDYSNFMRLNG